MVATTLNIHVDVLSKINHAAAKFRKSRKAIIVFLLKQLMMDRRVLSRGFTAVRYQQDDDKECWHTFHIRFREDDNEYFVDLRKFSKCSVSCLLAIAVNQYIDELLLNEMKEVDNYPFMSNYVLLQDLVDGIICWRIYWGYPGEHLKTLKL